MSSGADVAIADRLRRETRDLHDQIHALVGIGDDTGSPEGVRSGADALVRYARLLSAARRVHAHVEAHAMQLAAMRTALPDLAQRLKTPLIDHDLRGLAGIAPDVVQHLARGAHRVALAWPPLDSVVAVFGAMYVLEGSTLGGVVLARVISRTLPELVPAASAFLGSYGKQVGSMWQTFTAALGVAVTPEHADRCVVTARATFGALSSALRALGATNREVTR